MYRDVQIYQNNTVQSTVKFKTNRQDRGGVTGLDDTSQFRSI